MRLCSYERMADRSSERYEDGAPCVELATSGDLISLMAQANRSIQQGEGCLYVVHKGCYYYRVTKEGA